MEQRIGRYQILDEIASGGQGTVYRAFDPESSQVVAVKVLHPTLSQDRNYIERFRREASLAASIDHPNVVRIFEVGRDGDQHFMALEFLPESLARVIESGGQMRIDGAARFGVQIAEGLAAAHALGIVHRDVKPQNVLIGQDGSAKVTDFGIARGESFNTMTATGVVMGTPHYMSPEQARGERSDARSDVYSLGCMLYQMLAGEVPFKGETPLAVIRQQIEEQPRRLREVRRDLPSRLESVVERSMAKDPERRYQSAADMGQALGAAVPGRPTPAGTPPRTPTPPPQAAATPEQAPQRPHAVRGRPSRLTRLIGKGTGVILVLWGLFSLFIGQNNASEGEYLTAGLLLAAGVLALVGGVVALRRRGIAFGPLRRGRLTALLAVAGLALFAAGGSQQAENQPGPDLPSSGGIAVVSAVDPTPTRTTTPAPVPVAVPLPTATPAPVPVAVPLPTATPTSIPTQTRATAAIQSSNGLVAYWPGDGDANDVVGGHHGALRGGATFAPGIMGQAFSLPQSGAHVEILSENDDFNFEPTQPMTIVMWAERTAPVGRGMHLLGKRIRCDDSPIHYQMPFGGDDIGFRSGTGEVGGVGALASDILPLDEWKHIAVTFDVLRFRLYVNGILKGGPSFGTFAYPNNSPLIIGGSGGCETFIGLIDEVSIFNRALGADEIKAIYDAGGAGMIKPSVATPTSTPTPPALVAVAVPVAVAEGQKYGGTLKLGVADFGTMDPALMGPSEGSSIYRELTYDNAIVTAYDGTLTPWAIESWSANSDASQYLFTVRQGIMFHHGKELEAEDIKFTFDRILDEATESPLRGELDFIRRISTPNKFTAAFNLAGPNAYLPALLTDYHARILPSDINIEEITSKEFGAGDDDASCGPEIGCHRRGF